MTALRPAGKVVKHPARYSNEIIVLMRFLLKARTRVHDPFAGTGERLGSMADDRALTFTGTEIEPAFIVDGRVKVGDATDPWTYPPTLLCLTCGRGDEAVLAGDRCQAHHPSGYTIVTSPVYPNGMADHFITKDPNRRDRTYRSAAAAALNDPSYELDERNMGRWGYRGRQVNSTARMMYWHLARQSVACWGDAERVLLNVSDSIDGTRTTNVVGNWQKLLIEHGWLNQDLHPVDTKRFRDGANRDARVEREFVIEATR